MKLNGKSMNVPKEMGEVYINSDNRTMVPIRYIVESLGHEVKWNKKDKSVTIDNDILIKLGEKKVKRKSGDNFQMDTRAIIVNDRTYVPLRFIVEALSYEVTYMTNNKGYYIELNKI